MSECGVGPARRAAEKLWREQTQILTENSNGSWGKLSRHLSRTHSLTSFNTQNHNNSPNSNRSPLSACYFSLSPLIFYFISKTKIFRFFFIFWKGNCSNVCCEGQCGWSGMAVEWKKTGRARDESRDRPNRNNRMKISRCGCGNRKKHRLFFHCCSFDSGLLQLLLSSQFFFFYFLYQKNVQRKMFTKIEGGGIVSFGQELVFPPTDLSECGNRGPKFLCKSEIKTRVMTVCVSSAVDCVSSSVGALSPTEEGSGSVVGCWQPQHSRTDCPPPEKGRISPLFTVFPIVFACFHLARFNFPFFTENGKVKGDVVQGV